MTGPIQTLLDTLTQHMPGGAQWMYAGIVGSMLFGLALMAKGAKFAPTLAAVAFAGLGGLGGSFVAHWLGTPVWVTMGCCGLIGLIGGLVFFRIWLAVLLGSSFALGSLGLYYVKVLDAPLAEYGRQADQPFVVTLPESADLSATAESARIWGYLAENVPNFQTSFLAILISTVAAGVVFGLLMPKAARAIWAASAGTVFFLTGLIMLLNTIAPHLQDRLVSLGPWGWVIVGSLWTSSLVYNLHDCREKRPQKDADADSKKGKAALA